MGYRNYFAKISKKDFNDFLTKANNEEDFWIEPKDIFEFGELYSGDLINKIHLKSKKIEFKNDKLKTLNKDYEFYICNKEAITEAIGTYKEKINSYYKDMRRMAYKYWDREKLCLKPINLENLNDKEIEREINNYENYKLLISSAGSSYYKVDKEYYLDNPFKVISSSLYEYEIFNLIMIYKNFDFENDILLFYGG